MGKKKLWTIITLSIFLVFLSLIVNWYYFSNPTSFPNNDQVVLEINNIFPESNASYIQDRITLDSRHVIVPFISNIENYGLSYWIWQKHKWSVESIRTKGQPMIWEMKRDDPSSFYIVWNIHPNDQLSAIDFYFIRDRDYGSTNGNEYYYPRVQMEKKVFLQEKSYGFMQLPEEWVTYIKTSAKIESAKQPNFLYHNIFPDQNIFFGWIPYSQTNKEVFPESSINGNEYSNGQLTFEYVRILNNNELEF